MEIDGDLIGSVDSVAFVDFDRLNENEVSMPSIAAFIAFQKETKRLMPDVDAILTALDQKPSMQKKPATEELLSVDPIAVLPKVERRAVVDVGSGSTKFCIADVDPVTHQMIQMIFSESYPVPYQAALEKSEDHSFNREVRDLGLKTFKMIDDKCKEYGVVKIAAVATEAFRQSMNAESFVKEVHQTVDIPLRIISQKEEGAIAFFSAASSAGTESPDELVVWDIGTGSFQLTIGETENDIVVFMGNMGAVPFKNYIIDVVQGSDSEAVSSLHPLSEEDYIAADRFARALARKAFPIVKGRIRDVDGQVVGVGRLFTKSLLPLTENQDKITRSDLRDFIYSCIGKTKEELRDPFSDANLANAILVLGFMKALHIDEIHVLDAASIQGMLSYPPYWT